MSDPDFTPEGLMAIPASIRFKNPGAMWGNALARKWGAEPNAVVLHDGLGQGNNIAVFPDYTHGAAAQFDLWRSHYCGLNLHEAITKWSGGNSSPAYMNFLMEHTGLKPESIIMPSVLSGPVGLKLLKAQAQWEAGRPYPMTDDEWVQAQSMVFGSKPVSVTAPKKVEPHPTPKPEPSLLGEILEWLKKH